MTITLPGDPAKIAGFKPPKDFEVQGDDRIEVDEGNLPGSVGSDPDAQPFSGVPEPISFEPKEEDPWAAEAQETPPLPEQNPDEDIWVRSNPALKQYLKDMDAWEEEQAVLDAFPDEAEPDRPDPLKQVISDQKKRQSAYERQEQMKADRLEAEKVGKSVTELRVDREKHEAGRRVSNEFYEYMVDFAKNLEETGLVNAGDDASEYMKGMRLGYSGMGAMTLGGMAQVAMTMGRTDEAKLFDRVSKEVQKSFREGGNVPRVPSFVDIRSEAWLSDFADYLSYKSGEAIGNLAPTLAAMAAAGPKGGLGFLYVVSLGEVRQGLQEAGITDEDKIAQYAYPVAGVVAGLDMIFPYVVSKTLGKGVREKVVKGLIHAFVRGAARGGVAEGVPEAMQEATQVAAIAHAKDAKGLFDMEPVWNEFAADGKWQNTWIRIGEAAIGGSLGGVQVGGPLSALGNQAELKNLAKKGEGLLNPSDGPLRVTVTGDDVAKAQGPAGEAGPEGPKARSTTGQTAAAEQEAAQEPDETPKEPLSRDPDVEEARQRLKRAREAHQVAQAVQERDEDIEPAPEPAEAPAALEPQPPEDEGLPDLPEQATEEINLPTRELVRENIVQLDETRIAFNKFASEAKKRGELDLGSIEVDLSFMDEDGTTQTERLPADKAIAEVDQRMRGVSQLVRCLG